MEQTINYSDLATSLRAKRIADLHEELIKENSAKSDELLNLANDNSKTEALLPFFNQFQFYPIENTALRSELILHQYDSAYNGKQIIKYASLTVVGSHEYEEPLANAEIVARYIHDHGYQLYFYDGVARGVYQTISELMENVAKLVSEIEL